MYCGDSKNLRRLSQFQHLFFPGDTSKTLNEKCEACARTTSSENHSIGVASNRYHIPYVQMKNEPDSIQNFRHVAKAIDEYQISNATNPTRRLHYPSWQICEIYSNQIENSNATLASGLNSK